MSFSFSIESEIPNRQGRSGEILTPHGVIKTPAFIPVGTKATVKSVLPDSVNGLG
ncbi:MAG: tRNA-guanine(34) transglycosylase, partial [Actinomycetota bacterium]